MRGPDRTPEATGRGRAPAGWIVGALVLAALVALVWRSAAVRRSQPPPGPPGGESARPAAPRVPGFEVAAPVAMLADAETGQVLYAKNPDQPVHPASIVKVMTLLVALDAVERGFASLDDPVRVSRQAEAMGGSQVFLAAGEVFPLEKMLKAIAIASANDASVAVAEHIAGTEAAFVELMNRRAAELGMRATTFTNSHGLPPEQGEDPTLTTARDIVTMARELIRRHPRVLEWTATRREVFREQPRFVMDNTNRLIGAYEGADGLKTGFTEQAGYSVVATAARDGRRLVAVVMGAESDEVRVAQASQLLDLGFRAFRPVLVALEGEKVGSLRLRAGRPESVDVKAARTVRILTLGGDVRGVSRRVDFRPGLAPPIREGEAVGWVVGLLDGVEVTRGPVVTAAAIERASAVTIFGRWLRDLVGWVVPGALLGPASAAGAAGVGAR